MGFEIISLDGSLLLGLEPSDERPVVLGRSLMETMAFDEFEKLDSEDGHDIDLVKLCPSSGVFLWAFDTISARVFIVYAIFVHIKDRELSSTVEVIFSTSLLMILSMTLRTGRAYQLKTNQDVWICFRLVTFSIAYCSTAGFACVLLALVNDLERDV